MSVAYPITPWLPTAQKQATGNSDRELCALVTAYAAHCKGETLGGALYGTPRDQIDTYFKQAVLEHNVLESQFSMWALGAMGVKLRSIDAPLITHWRVGDLVLDEYQLHVINQVTCAGHVLALGVGLGKTLTSVAIAQLAAQYDHVRTARCWIVCPLNAIPAWEPYIPILEADYDEVRVLSMDSAHNYSALANAGGFIIYDECHLLGSLSARRTKHCHTLRSRFDYGLCLTGTLLHGGIEKTLSILDLAVPGMSLFSNRWKAGAHFRCLVRKRLGSRTVSALEKPSGDARVEFIEYLSRATVSMSKESGIVRHSVDLPPQHLRTIELGTPWAKIEDDITACAHEYLAEHGELPHMQYVAHALARRGMEVKVDWLLEQLDDPDMGIVVFAMYRDTLDYAERRLRDAGCTLVRVDGDIVGADRMRCRDNFQAGRVQLFLGQMDAACTSMDLYRGHVSVALDHTWKAANYDQALGRTCRRGQTRTCYHFDLVANKFQSMVLSRLRAACDFDASVTEWQDGLRLIKEMEYAQPR